MLIHSIGLLGLCALSAASKSLTQRDASDCAGHTDGETVHLNEKTQQYIVHCQTEAFGNSFAAAVKTDNDAKCVNLCDENDACASAQWNEVNQDCTFTGTRMTLQPDPDTVLFVKVTPSNKARDVADCQGHTEGEVISTNDSSPKYVVYCEREEFGNLLEPAMAADDHDSCMLLCDEQPDCTAAQYNVHTSQCELKNDAEHFMKGNADSIIMVKQPAPAVSKRNVADDACPGDWSTSQQYIASGDKYWYKLECNWGVLGNVLGLVTNTDRLNCMRFCDSKGDACVAAMFDPDGGFCEIKSKMDGTHYMKQGGYVLLRTGPSPGRRDVKTIQTRDVSSVNVDCPPKDGYNRICIDEGAICYTYVCDQALDGDNINQDFVTTAESCGQFCSITRGCTAAVWRPAENFCALKTGTQTQISKPGAILMTRALKRRTREVSAPATRDLVTRDAVNVRACPGDWDERKLYSVNGGKTWYDVECNYLSEYNGIAWLTAKTREDCIKACDSKVTICVGATYNPFTGYCELKSGQYGTRAPGYKGLYAFWRSKPKGENGELVQARDLTAPAAICPEGWQTGQTFCVDGGSCYDLNCGFITEGGDIGGYTTLSYDACLARCDSHPNCISAQWNGVDNRCDIKSSVGAQFAQAAEAVFTKTSATRQDEKAIEARKTSKPTDECPLGIDFDQTLCVSSGGCFGVVACAIKLGGDSIEDFSTTDPEKCMLRCDEHKDCVAVQFNFGDSTCQLKTTLSGSQTAQVGEVIWKKDPATVARRHLAPRAGNCPPYIDDLHDICVMNLNNCYYTDCDFGMPGGTTVGTPLVMAYDVCLFSCGSTPNCIGVQWTEASQLCRMMSATGPEIPMQGEIIFMKRVGGSKNALAPILLITLSTRQHGPDVTYCIPGDTTHTTGNLLGIGGQQYQLTCDVGSDYGNIDTASTETSYESCSYRCRDTPQCQQFQFSPSTNKCQMNNGAGFITVEGDFVLRKMPIGPPGHKRDVSHCIPGDSTDTTGSHMTIGGQLYILTCDAGNIGNWNVYNPSTESTYEGCADRCTKTAECAQFQYSPSSHTCVMNQGAGSVPVQGDFVLHKLPMRKNLKRGEDRGKRGLAYNDPNKVGPLRGVPDSKIAWAWNWYSVANGQNCDDNTFAGATAIDGLVYVPDMFSSADQCLADKWFINVDFCIAHYRTDSVLSFNEPDMGPNVGGSQLGTDEAVDGYRQYMQPLAGRVALGAPATTFKGRGVDGGWAWIRDFMAKCNDCQIDFIPIHYYVKSENNVYSSIADFQNELHWLIENLNRPLWITEMSYTGDNVSESDEIIFMRAMIDFFEQNDWISRYSYRTAEDMTLPDGTLSLLGYCYACFRSGGEGDGCCLDTPP